MKTTVEIPDSLLREAEEVASREHTTLETLLAEGLRLVIRRHPAAEAGFVLRDASFRGNGLQAGLDEDDWGAIRALAYEDSGG